MIRKATYSDIDAILKLTNACAMFMICNNIYQWNEHYPNKTAFETDVLRDELFVLVQNSTLIGCVVVSSFMDEEYQPIKWLTPSDKNSYIHRLAIHPEFQSQGYAQQLMDFAETFALKNKCHSVRLDTFSQNHRNQKFYEQRGYERLGSIYFPKQSEYPFYCYELVL
ncbi:MAG: GNAT family N-acetyltransferase [Gelidibacter sp.]